MNNYKESKSACDLRSCLISTLYRIRSNSTRFDNIVYDTYKFLGYPTFGVLFMILQFYPIKYVLYKYHISLSHNFGFAGR